MPYDESINYKITQTYLDKLVKLEKLKLNKNQYLIWGSGPLAIRGIRSSRDIDIVVSKDLWKQLIIKYKFHRSQKDLINIEDIEIWNSCLNLSDRIDEMLLNKDIIFNYPFMKLSDTIEWKKFISNDKHIEDIKLINKYMSK